VGCLKAKYPFKEWLSSSQRRERERERKRKTGEHKSSPVPGFYKVWNIPGRMVFEKRKMQNRCE
jgi:hypothetical protein